MTKLTFISIVVPFAAGVAWCQTANPDTPLASLPYSPSLDVSSMDRTVDPCTDFYRYSCGSWIKNNPIPPDQARWNVYSKLANENQRFLWGILEQAAKPAAGRRSATIFLPAWTKDRAEKPARLRSARISIRSPR
jgi:putative endopeptidase